MKMAVKVLAPQLEKLAGVIQSLEKNYGTQKGVLVMQNELNEKGEMKPVLMLMGVDEGKLHILKDAQGVEQKFSIAHLGDLIAGGIEDED